MKDARTDVSYAMAQLACGRSTTRAVNCNTLNNSGFVDQAMGAEWNLRRVQERFEVLSHLWCYDYLWESVKVYDLPHERYIGLQRKLNTMKTQLSNFKWMNL